MSKRGRFFVKTPGLFSKLDKPGSGKPGSSKNQSGTISAADQQWEPAEGGDDDDDDSFDDSSEDAEGGQPTPVPTF